MFKNIIYFLPAQKKPSGGAKVIYNHSNIINKFAIRGLSSSIIHYKKKKYSKYLESIKKRLPFRNDKEFGYKFKDFKIVKNFKPDSDWFNEKINYKNNLEFDKKNDFIIFPEIIAHFAKDICFKKKIKYAIFSLGIYHMYQTNDLKIIDEVYSKSEFILDISEDTRKCLLKIFPNLKKKILRVNLSIDEDKFKFSKSKKNVITCMPRKALTDFQLLNFFIYKKIPKSWKLIVLQNMSNSQIAKNLSLSRIFLSFSNFEGLGLPPIEAAICGNKVIGYSGEGGKEYFKKPLFEVVSKGNIYDLTEKILKNIKNLKKDWHLNLKNKKARLKLSSNYSNLNEIKSVKKITRKILKIL